jgi:hypothetical protein
MVAGHLHDKDLYILTCISHQLAFIACPLYLVRKSLTFSSFNNFASLNGEAYKALDVLCQSPQFPSLKSLCCSFSCIPDHAATQRRYLHQWFDSLPSQTTDFFKDVSFNFIAVESPWDLLHLIQSAASATGCSTLSLFSAFYLEGASGDRTSKRVTYTTVTPALKNLQRLQLSDFSLTLLQWGIFLTNLGISSLCSLEIWNDSSQVAMFDFLDWHRSISKLRLFKSHWTNTSLISHQLKLPYPHTLHGYLYQTLRILKSLASPPSIEDLYIEADLTMNLRQGEIFDQVVHCLSMCGSLYAVQICLLTDMTSLPLTTVCVHARAARKLRSTTLPQVSSLFISFVCMHDIIPVGRLSYPIPPVH